MLVFTAYKPIVHFTIAYKCNEYSYRIHVQNDIAGIQRVKLRISLSDKNTCKLNMYPS